MPEQSPPAVTALVLGLMAGSFFAWQWLIGRMSERECPLARARSASGPKQWWGARLNELLLSPGNFWTDVRAGIIGFLIAVVPVFAMQSYLVKWFPYHHQVTDELLRRRDLDTLLKAVLTAVVIAPLSEELIFRALFQGRFQWLERRWRRKFGSIRWLPLGVVPITLSSLVFGLAHWGHGAAPLPLFLFALVLGYLYYQTGRIIPSVVAHASLNANSLIVLWLSMTSSQA